MPEWPLHRTWKQVEVMPLGKGFAVALDGKIARTPDRRPLALPTRQAAQLVAAEWEWTERRPRRVHMCLTRLATTAIDLYSDDRQGIVARLLEYGEFDAVCFREPHRAELADRQRQHWDPLIDWVATEYGACMRIAETGFALDNRASLAILRRPLSRLNAFELASLELLTSSMRSLLLGLAVLKGYRSFRQGWELSRIEEDWFIEFWGEDPDESRKSRDSLRELKRASLFLQALDERHPKRRTAL